MKHRCIIPHRGDMTLFRDENNWQPLCRTVMIEKQVAGCSSYLKTISLYRLLCPAAFIDLDVIVDRNFTAQLAN